MHFPSTYNYTSFDAAFPPTASTFASATQPTDVGTAARAPRSYTRAGRTVRTLAVLCTSFGVVFGALYTVITWPLVPQEASYYLSQLSAPTEQTASAAGESTAATVSYTAPDPASTVDTDHDGIKDSVEVRYYGTDPRKADSDGDGYSDLTEIVNGYSPLKASDYQQWIADHSAATIRIPKINVKAPVVWNQDLSKIYDDLKRGAVHYRGTANPGEAGNNVIVAHSSSYVWDSNQFGTLFALLDKLKPGDKVYLDYVGTTYTYVVEGTSITKPTDTQMFAPSGEQRLTLGSCWPAGTNEKRIFVVAKLTGTAAITR
ncbi:MAG: sortase [Candidatus Andersenbacteria bacterium]